MRRKPGFMLLELLIAITIFAGVMILALGAFARSATSAAKANTVRARTEAARAVVDQISNDFHYIDPTHTPPGCPALWPGKGFCLDSVSGYPNSLQLLLKYPGTNTYTSKTYVVDVTGEPTLKVTSQTDCDIVQPPSVGVSTRCAAPGTSGSYRTVLPTNYVLELPLNERLFEAQADTPTVRGYLTLDLTVKPTGQGSCSASGCYELKTTLVPGGIQ